MTKSIEDIKDAAKQELLAELYETLSKAKEEADKDGNKERALALRDAAGTCEFMSHKLFRKNDEVPDYLVPIDYLG